MVKLDRRWWLTADGSKAVPDGDPNAAYLFGNPGLDVPEDRARELGILAPPKPVAAPKPKRSRRAGMKQRTSPEDAAEE